MSSRATSSSLSNDSSSLSAALFALDVPFTSGRVCRSSSLTLCDRRWRRSSHGAGEKLAVRELSRLMLRCYLPIDRLRSVRSGEREAAAPTSGWEVVHNVCIINIGIAV